MTAVFILIVCYIEQSIFLALLIILFSVIGA
jgi:hypothetical protein